MKGKRVEIVFKEKLATDESLSWNGKREQGTPGTITCITIGLDPPLI
jgi:hypothetical protein